MNLWFGILGLDLYTPPRNAGEHQDDFICLVIRESRTRPAFAANFTGCSEDPRYGFYRSHLKKTGGRILRVLTKK